MAINETVTEKVTAPLNIRPLHYRDLDGLEQLLADPTVEQSLGQKLGQALGQHAACPGEGPELVQWLRRWYGPLKLLSWVPNPWRHLADFRVATADRSDRDLLGLVQVTPINRSHSTWQFSRVIAEGCAAENNLQLAADVGSQLLRHCLETIWEARTWVTEVGVNDEASIALYRQNGFQPLAQITDWQIAPQQLAQLAEKTPQLPNLLPVSNADAHLLYQLDTVAMPPLLRQVFDRHVQDFRAGLSRTVVGSIGRMFRGTDRLSAYVFEPQRKAAIGYVKLQLSRSGETPHQAELTVHPAYTWLYPELMAYMAQCLQDYPQLPLQISSADYQPEREACFQQCQAEPSEHRLMLSRSVWHKLREARGVSERLQFADVLQGLQPNRQPIPGRISLDSLKHSDLLCSELFWDRWDYPCFPEFDRHFSGGSAWPES